MSLTIAGTYTTGVTLASAAQNPVSVTGTIAVTYGYALSGGGGYGETWTINNSGLLQATDAQVVNLGSIAGPVDHGVIANETGGTIAGGTYGVAINGPGAVINQVGATISAGTSQGVFIYGPGTVTNAGLIRAGNVAVYLAAGGSVTNSAAGTIFGAGGIWMQQPGTVLNAGPITGTNAGFGAVSFGAYTYYNRLIVDPGARFNGNVSGGGGVLELAQGGAAGTLTGLGTSITNFTTLQFDANADWTVVGNAAGLTGTIEGFNPLATIDLTGFAGTSASFGYNVLQLSNGSGSYAELQILGNFASTNFRLAGDGSGGVLVSELLIPGTYSWIGTNANWTLPANWDHGSVPGAADTAVIANPGSNTVTIAAGQTVSIGSIVLGPDTLEVDGTLLAGGTLSIDTGVVVLAPTGLIAGGTIADPAGYGFAFAGGTLSTVTYQGPLEFAASGAQLAVANGLTVTDATGSLPGVIDLTGGGASIDFIGNQNFDNATINLNSADGAAPQTAIGIGGAGGSVLTLGPNALVNSDAFAAQANIASLGAAQTALVNQGTIIAGAGSGNFVIGPAASFANQGTIEVANGDTLSIQPVSGAFANSGFVAVDGVSTLRLVGDSGFDNTGTISLDAGATLDLAGSFTLPLLGNVLNQGAVTQIDGTLDVQGGTLALGDGTSLGSILLQGEIANAVIQANGALSIGPGNAALLNDTYAGPIALNTDATALTIHEGVTLTDATGSLPASISVTGRNDTLAFANAALPGSAGQTLDNVVIDIGNALGADTIAAAFNGGTFTLGAGTTIESSISHALVTLAAGAGTAVVLDGTLNVAAQNGSFAITGPAFTNDGQVLVGNGDTLSVASPAAGTGTIAIATHGVAGFGAAVAAGESVLFIDATGTLRVSQPGSFAATIDGFAAGDTIDLAGVPASTATWSPGELTIRHSGTVLGTLAISGDYSAVGFAVSYDGAGGSDIAIGDPAPQIAGLPADQALPVQASESLFASVQVTDPNISNVDTATVALSAPTAGTLQNLAGGSYDAATGVYTVTGTAGTLTGAIEGLHFVPANTANGLISTVTFSLSAEGPGGSSSVATTSLTQVPQFLWLSGGPSSPVAVSSPPDGKSIRPSHGQCDERGRGDEPCARRQLRPAGWLSGGISRRHGGRDADRQCRRQCRPGGQQRP